MHTLHLRLICLVEIAHMVMEKKMKKLYDNNNDDNDDDKGKHKNFDQKSSLNTTQASL